MFLGWNYHLSNVLMGPNSCYFELLAKIIARGRTNCPLIGTTTVSVGEKRSIIVGGHGDLDNCTEIDNSLLHCFILQTPYSCFVEIIRIFVFVIFMICQSKNVWSKYVTVELKLIMNLS